VSMSREPPEGKGIQRGSRATAIRRPRPIFSTTS
jgi:hypothetical protein